MTEFTTEQYTEKVAQCTDALRDLDVYKQTTTLEFVRANPDTYYAICYRFISAIEALFDIGAIVLASKGVRASTQREVAQLLEKQGSITAEQSIQFADMYGFRNRLVHAYGTLHDERVVTFLQTHTADMHMLLQKLEAAAL